MRGWQILLLTGALGTGSFVAAADPYDSALEQRVARLEEMLRTRPARPGVAAQWKQAGTDVRVGKKRVLRTLRVRPGSRG